ncbi:MAG: hypothetical protein AAF639_33925 [Chloroflexota bacterium]
MKKQVGHVTSVTIWIVAWASLPVVCNLRATRPTHRQDAYYQPAQIRVQRKFGQTQRCHADSDDLQ